MKKIIGFAAVITSATTVSGCSNADTNLSINLNTDQLIASSMYTIGSTVNDVQSSVSSKRDTRTKLTEDQYSQVSNSLQKYVDSVDKLMTDELSSNFSENTTTSIEGIDNYEYIYELILNDSIYVIAYNKGEPTVESDNDEIESNANLAGKMFQIINNEVAITLDLVGYEEQELEEDEIENEFFIKAKDNQGNYVKYEYSSEVDNEDEGEESDAKITFKSEINEVKTYSETKLEIDNEDGFEVDIIDKVESKTETYISEYEYSRSYDDEFDITYTYKTDDFEAEGIVEVSIVNGVYKYTFVDTEADTEYVIEEEDDL